jgi:hypothetical protein
VGRESRIILASFRGQKHSEGSEPMPDRAGVKVYFGILEAYPGLVRLLIRLGIGSVDSKGLKKASVLGSCANKGRDRQTGTGI